MTIGRTNASAGGGISYATGTIPNISVPTDTLTVDVGFKPKMFIMYGNYNNGEFSSGRQNNATICIFYTEEKGAQRWRIRDNDEYGYVPVEFNLPTTVTNASITFSFSEHLFTTYAWPFTWEAIG